jgi:hypothetical protein
MSKSGSPASTASPTCAWHFLTIPEIFDLTWNLRRGSILPTATALSVIEPLTTSIFLRPSSAPLRLCINAYAPTTAPARTARTMRILTTLPMRRPLRSSVAYS